MKKTVLFIFLLCTISWSLIGQASIEPNPASAEVDPDALDVVAHSTIKNEGDKEETYRWQRTVIEMTEGWETAVCDKNLCYIPVVETESFELGAGQEDILDVHVYPYGIEGQAHIELSLMKESNGEELAKGVYLFNMDVTGTLQVERTELVVYPNPTTEYFQLSTSVAAQHLEVYNAIGKRIGSFSYEKGGYYNIVDYPRGFYFVKILDRDYQTLGVKRLQKL